MPRIKPLDEYPKEYFDLFEKAYSEGEVRIEQIEYAEAKALRTHLYTFRRVLRKTDGYEPEIAKANQIKIYIEPGFLILKKRNGFGEDKIKEALNG